MHIFLYEWATGGGLVEETGALPASLVREGTAMIGAVAADLARVPGCRLSALRDPRVLQLVLPGCNVVDAVSTFSHNEEFDRLAGEADATILIAPEFDGILLKAAKRVIASGGQLASPSPEFIRVAASKERTCATLAAAGVPTPVGRTVEPDEPLPADFQYPAVLKPNDGAGSQDTYLVSSARDAPPAYAWQRRLEQYVPGMPVSAGLLCGPAGGVPLAPCTQRLSDDGRFRYLGGELPLAPGLAFRALELSQRAIVALPPATGYVGVDMILGRDPNGGEDVVVEVNPRLTTSYAGLRAAAKVNLADAMLKVSKGELVDVAFNERLVEFDPGGNVSFVR